MRAEIRVDTSEIAMRVRILHVACKQAPAAFEDASRPVHAGAREHRRGNPALRRPPRMEKLGLRAVHPAFEQAGCETARDPGRARYCFRVQSEQLRSQIRRAKRGKQARRMKSALMQ